MTQFAAMLLVLATGCLAGIVGTLLATQSPREAAAERQPPLLPPPTAPVEKRVLRQVLRAPCEPVTPAIAVTLPRLPAGTPAVVTAIAKAGAGEIRTGQRLATVSGRPLVAFVTTLPFYRDIVVGDTGPDVRALERSLQHRALIRHADRFFDAASAAAVSSLYARAGRPAERSGFILAASVSVPPGSRIASVNVSVGEVVGPRAELLSVSGRPGRLSCAVTPDSPVSVGQRIRLEAPGASGIVVVDRVVAGSAGEPGHVEVRGTSNGAAPDAGELVIDAAATPDKVLSVPVSAIFAAPDGSLAVHKVSGVQDERPASVSVTTGLSSAGYVEIRPSKPGTLAPGDEVVVQSGSDEAVGP